MEIADTDRILSKDEIYDYLDQSNQQALSESVQSLFEPSKINDLLDSNAVLKPID